MGLVSLSKLGSGAIDRLMDYDWPGNVRELSNVVERALIQSGGKVLTFDDVPGHAKENFSTAVPSEKDNLALNVIERQHIRRVMEITGGRVEGENGAAKLLDMNPGTLRHKMRKLGIAFGRRKKRNRF